MKCDICNTEAENGSMIFGQGFACSKDCAQIARGRRKAIHDELSAEPIGQMPEVLETADFERWALKFAVIWLRGLSKADRKKLGGNNPMMLIPEELALDFKDRIIRHLHPAYISEVETRGHARLFHGGTYCFRQAVPAEKIVEAARKADLIN